MEKKINEAKSEAASSRASNRERIVEIKVTPEDKTIAKRSKTGIVESVRIPRKAIFNKIVLDFDEPDKSENDDSK